MKVHLLDSDEPIKEGKSYIGLCDTDIGNAVFVFAVDSATLTEDEEQTLNALSTCQQCITAQKSKRYLYGLVSGQELRASL